MQVSFCVGNWRYFLSFSNVVSQKSFDYLSLSKFFLAHHLLSLEYLFWSFVYTWPNRLAGLFL